jgi:plastocyanin
VIRAALAIAVVAAAPVAAHADDGRIEGTVTVTRPEGVDPGPVLVYVVGFTEKAPSKTVTVLQKNREFQPDLVAITAGQSVAFPNGDPFLHNVFSPTRARSFDLGSYRKGKTKSRKFPKAGVVDVFCNIHPQMSATIVVLPNRRFTFVADDGSFAIDGVPEGTWKVFAYSRRAVAPVHAEVEVGGSGTTTVDLALEETVRDFTHTNKYGEAYRDDRRYR